MADIVVLGAGPIGLTTAMLLAGDGHRVTVLDRDATAPGGPAGRAWDAWERPGVKQFRQPHLLLARGLGVLAERLPEVVAELRAAGGVRYNMIAKARELPGLGGVRPGDERFEALAARRPVLEAAIAAVAARTPGVTVHRGIGVTGLVTGAARLPGRPHITGVRTADGRTVRADLVVDAGGRHSPVAGMLAGLGGPPPVEEREEAGFIYYSRFFRSADGTPPEPVLWTLEHHAGASTLALPADSGTWSLTIAVSARDRALRGLHDVRAWNRAMRLFPALAQWAAGEPITGVRAMAGIENRRRRLVVDGLPVATGLLSVGDAWAATDPMFGLGLSMGLVHAAALSETVRETGLADPEKPALRFDAVTEATLAPVYRWVRGWDRHRLAELDGEARGEPYRTDDPGWAIGKAMQAAKLRDPDILRGVGEIAMMLAPAEEVVARPGMLDKIITLGGDAPRFPAHGPSYAELLAAVTGE